MIREMRVKRQMKMMFNTEVHVYMTVNRLVIKSMHLQHDELQDHCKFCTFLGDDHSSGGEWSKRGYVPYTFFTQSGLSEKMSFYCLLILYNEMLLPYPYKCIGSINK